MHTDQNVHLINKFKIRMVCCIRDVLYNLTQRHNIAIFQENQNDIPIPLTILFSVCKMKIIDTLTGQLLTYVALRDMIEESYDTWQNTRKELREFIRAERHREREEATAR